MPLSMLRLARQHTCSYLRFECTKNSRTEVLILSNGKYDAESILRYDTKTPHLLLPSSVSFSEDRSLSILREEDLITRAHLYLRPLCNTTIIATSYSFDLLVDGTVERVRIPPLPVTIRPLAYCCISVDHLSEYLRRMFLNTQRPSRSTSVHPSPRRLNSRVPSS